MEYSLSMFISELAKNPALILTAILVLGVVFVNGWTDAPNAIATCISTRSIKPRAAILMAAVFNFIGVFVMMKLSPKVATTIYKMVDFTKIETVENAGLIGLCAAMLGIVIWATAAWYFGIPTSESHALIAGLSGAALAMGGIDAISLAEWSKVLFGLAFTTVFGFVLGYVIVRIVEFIASRCSVSRNKSESFFGNAQVFAAALTAYMHGAQDGQKFIGVFALGLALTNASGSNFSMEQAPLWLIVLVSLVMGVGTSVGGMRIIKSVGMDMVKLKKYQGFSADLAASICMFFASTGAMPISTTQAKAVSIMGVGAARRLSAVKLSVVKEMVLTWVLTFPGCGLISYLTVKLALLIF